MKLTEKQFNMLDEHIVGALEEVYPISLLDDLDFSKVCKKARKTYTYVTMKDILMNSENDQYDIEGCVIELYSLYESYLYDGYLDDYLDDYALAPVDACDLYLEDYVKELLK